MLLEMFDGRIAMFELERLVGCIGMLVTVVTTVVECAITLSKIDVISENSEASADED